jgi:hypothetical protein
MLLTNDELIGAFTHEVNVLRHLITKIHADAVDFRATPGQRSNIELVRYLVVQGPQLTTAIRTGSFDRDAWGAAQAESDAADLAGLDAILAKHPAWYAEQIGAMHDDDFRGTVQLFGPPATRGVLLVTLVLANYAAYRTQLFCNLKLGGRAELNTSNLWRGVDSAPRA